MVSEPQRPYGVKTVTGGVRLYLTYNLAFVSWVKDNVPQEARSYDESEKSWYIGESYAAKVIAYASTRFPGFHMLPGKRGYEDMFGGHRTFTQPPPVFRPPSHYATLYVTHNAPPAVIKAAYKALARLYHPDGGTGDTAKMQELNAAFDAIKKERKL